MIQPDLEWRGATHISYRLGDKVGFDKKDKAFSENPEIAQAFENMRANLEAVGVDLAQTKYQSGHVLEFDAKAEKFVGTDADKANAFLARKCREPYVVRDSA